MTRRPTWLSAAVIGGAIALMSMSAAPVFAQAAPEAPPEGGYTVYPDYADVDCDGTFNGVAVHRQPGQDRGDRRSTVVFTLCAAGPGLPAQGRVLALRHQRRRLPHRRPVADGSLVDNPNGTGPFVLEEWRRGQEVIFAVNPDYWGEAPMNARSVLRWSSEPGQKLIELQSGTVDGIDNPSVDDLDAIESDPAPRPHPA